MKYIYFTPGPTQLHPAVTPAIGEALQSGVCSFSHRGRNFEKIFEYTIGSLRKFLQIPDTFQIFFLGSATEAMERVLENCVAEYSYHFVNGAFSGRFFETAKELNKKPQKYEVEFGRGFDFKQVQIPPGTELICFTQSETSCGVAIPMEDIYAIKKRYPKSLIAVDVVSALPYVDIDYSFVDCAFFSVQKGFGLPAGLGVVVVRNEIIKKAQLLQEKGYFIGGFHSFPLLFEKAQKNQTFETPNALNIYTLGKVCDSLYEYGIDKMRSETEQKAELLYTFFDGHPSYAPFVQDKNVRSKTVAVIQIPGGSQGVIQKLKEQGFIVGTGYGDYRDRHIRIANFPMHKVEDVEKLLQVM